MADPLVPPGFELEEPPLAPPLRELFQIVQFKAYYKTITKGTRGDYELKLGIPFQEKDLAWVLSDYDGRMLEVVCSTLKRMGPLPDVD